MELAASVGSTDVRRSLRTRSPPFARQRARTVLIVIEEAFETPSRQDITTDHSVTGADDLQARFNANTWSGRGEGGHRFGLAAFGIAPYSAAQITTVALPGCTETALSGAGDSYSG